MVKRDLIDPFNSMVFDKQLQSEIHGEHDLSWYAAFYFPGFLKMKNKVHPFFKF